jgi:hypothetical protein
LSQLSYANEKVFILISSKRNYPIEVEHTMKKRAQITMESLLLYGAAVLVVLLAVAALTYFGVLDMGRWLPQKCNLGSSTVECVGQVSSLGGSTISVEVKNKDAQTIELLGGEFISKNTDLVDGCSDTMTATEVLPGETEVVDISCSTFNVKKGDRITGTISVTHRFKGGKLDMKSAGDMSVTVTG